MEKKHRFKNIFKSGKNKEKKNKVKKKRNKNEYPLKRVLVLFSVTAFVAALVCAAATMSFTGDVIGGKAPESEHNIGQLNNKDETVYIYTDNSGKAQSAVVNAYLKNNQEQPEIRDRTELKNIINVDELKNPPTDNKDGTVTWKTNGKDVSYEGEGNVKELPVSVDVRYFLNGREIEPDMVEGVSGYLEIQLSYKSTETAYVNGKNVNVPYFATSMVTFENELTHIKVSSGKVIKDGSSSVVLCTAMPGASSIIGPGADLGYSDIVTISGTASDFSENQIVTTCSGDALTLIDNESVANMNMDDVVDWLGEASKETLADSKKTAYAMRFASSNVAPKAVDVTHKIKDKTEELSEKMPETLKKIRKATGQVAAKADVATYTLNQIEKKLNKHEKTTKKDYELAKKEVKNSISELKDKVKLSKLKEEAVLDAFVEAGTVTEGDSVYNAFQDSINNLDAILKELDENGISSKVNKLIKITDTSEKLLQEIYNMLNKNSWLKNEIKSKRINKYLTSRELYIFKKYIKAIKNSEGKYESVLDVTSSLPYRSKELYNVLDKLLKQKNKKSLVGYTKTIAEAMRDVDQNTIRLAELFGSATSSSERITQQMDEIYTDYICDLTQRYDTNIRGITERINVLKQAEEQASVYSGLSEDMEGTSLYMIFTPIGAEKNSIADLLK